MLLHLPRRDGGPVHAGWERTARSRSPQSRRWSNTTKLFRQGRDLRVSCAREILCEDRFGRTAMGSSAKVREDARFVGRTAPDRGGGIEASGSVAMLPLSRN